MCWTARAGEAGSRTIESPSKRSAPPASRTGSAGAGGGGGPRAPAGADPGAGGRAERPGGAERAVGERDLARRLVESPFGDERVRGAGGGGGDGQQATGS